MVFSECIIIMSFTFILKGGGGGGEDGRGCCWENNIGQELFKLNLTHLLADTATMTVDVSRWVLPKIPHMGKLGKLAEMVGYIIPLLLKTTNHYFVQWSCLRQGSGLHSIE